MADTVKSTSFCRELNLDFCISSECFLCGWWMSVSRWQNYTHWDFCFHFRPLLLLCDFFYFILLFCRIRKQKEKIQCSVSLLFSSSILRAEGKKPTTTKKEEMHPGKCWILKSPAIHCICDQASQVLALLVLSGLFSLRHLRDVPCLFSPLYLTFMLMNFA